ncbi:hypothetical protein NP493_1631g00031 [Ridgeia piscesae]|uniref:Serpin domain-containing protein n=1 Tax=Ridgeia piscesae TaxID=27915 RepID=A0AAD9N855_RIDPI|nr:hypothetical protein NP493_1631g00031 [Ridgeia piscesae]
MAVSKARLFLGVVLLGLSQPGLSSVTDELVAANNDFAMDLYGQIKNDPSKAGKNIFFSAFSVSSALGMVYAGSRGNTKTQMGTAMKFDSVTGDIHDGFLQLFTAFNDPTNNYTLSVANALFSSKDYTILQSYIDIVKQYYLSFVKTMDFKSNPEPSRTYINKWVADHTNQKIKELFQQGTISPNTVVALVNAIYFKGLWKEPFETKYTKPDTFFLSATKTKKTNMMNLKGKKFNYAEVANLGCKIIELPYDGDEVSMYILLPDETIGLSALESQITSASINAAISSMYKQPVGVSMPKFKMTMQIDLKDILKALGMTDAFVPNLADLSGIDGTRKLLVSAAVHEAYVDVNEEGTEAAAATGVGISVTSIQIPKTFKADHPFLFFIREKVTGSILFSGRVLDPPKAEGTATTTGSDDNPSWCEDLPDWLCDLMKWLGCGYTTRSSSDGDVLFPQ